MEVAVASVRTVLVFALSLILSNPAKAQQPVQIESDAGAISMIVTGEAVDVTNQLPTVSGPNNNWVEVKVTLGLADVKLSALSDIDADAEHVRFFRA
jgi:copper chaperone CopZ